MGLYILAPGIGAVEFENSCRLLLPFDIGGCTTKQHGVLFSSSDPMGSLI